MHARDPPTNRSTLSSLMSSTAGGIPPVQANTLDAMLARKQQLDEDLRQIEKAIVEGEESYLEETNHYGNVVKGWDGFLTSRPKPHGTSHHATKRVNVALKDRIWSLSSTTAPIQDDQHDMELDEFGGGGGAPLKFTGDGLPPRLSTSMSGGGDRRSGRQVAKTDEGDMSD